MSTLLDDVQTRIGARVTDLSGRMGQAADLAALLAQKQLPQQSPYAFLLSLGLDGRDPDASAGIFRQNFEEAVGVVVVVQAPGDATARAALPKVDVLVEALLAAICGWSPAAAPSYFFKLRRGRLLPMAAGAVFYQVDFALQRQLRIT